MIASNSNSPRQKMINLMYLVFIAMLAMNIPAEVLDGLEMVEDNLTASVQSAGRRNRLIMSDFEQANKQNPTKVGEWYKQAVHFKQVADSMYAHIGACKLLIVRQADGEEGTLSDIQKKDNLTAAAEVMLSSEGRGKQLEAQVKAFRALAISDITDPQRKKVVEENLALKPSKIAAREGKDWVQSLFKQMPVMASVTLLTKLQNDIRQAEGEVLASLLANIDVGDFRVNQLNAYVVPKSNIVMRGSNYEANIILSAEDSTKRPRFFVNGRYLDEAQRGLFRVGTGAVGTFPVKGFIELARADGSLLKREFTSEYTVIAPMATVAPTLMNLLYAGIPNELSISVPGVPTSDISATMENGTLTRNGDKWLARPSKVGQDATIVVTAKVGNATQEMARVKFRVRALPDPTPYIEYADANGNLRKFKGGRLSKGVLVNANGIKAAIDDDFLNISFTVLSFTTIFIDGMGNAIPEVSNGANFSDRQKEQISRLQRGRMFFIAGVKAKGPDGVERDISPIEVRVN